MLPIALYWIQVSSKAFLVLAALLVIAGLYIIINPKAFLRWGRRGNYSGKEPEKSAVLAARLVGAAVIAMAVIAYVGTNQS